MADLTTTALCRTYMDIKATITDPLSGDDLLIDYIRKGAEAWFLGKVDLPISDTEFTEYHDGDGYSGSFCAKNHPITQSESQVTLWDDTAHAYGDATKKAAADFRITPSIGKIELVSSAFALGVRNIKFTYKAGYATIPGDVPVAIWMLVAERYRMTKDKREGIASKGGGQGGTITFTDEDAPKFVLSVIEKYARMP